MINYNRLLDCIASYFTTVTDEAGIEIQEYFVYENHNPTLSVTQTGLEDNSGIQRLYPSLTDLQENFAYENYNPMLYTTHSDLETSEDTYEAPKPSAPTESEPSLAYGAPEPSAPTETELESDLAASLIESQFEADLQAAIDASLEDKFQSDLDIALEESRFEADMQAAITASLEDKFQADIETATAASLKETGSSVYSYDPYQSCSSAFRSEDYFWETGHSSLDSDWVIA
ncbi:MAG: hypothetical protein MRQ09_03365 [Candidatus Midichloria sp.]|nr:hypothetical protein [Candidatus Midichloria sp.]